MRIEDRLGFRGTRAAGAAIAALALSATGCGGGGGGSENVCVQIDDGGGLVKSSDGVLQLVFSPGALAE
jgi:hypothetical protein